MIKIREIAILICTCVATIALSACGEWPPHGRSLAEYVKERKPQIEKLVSEFAGSEFARIDCQPCFADMPRSEWDSVSYKIIDGMWQRSENPRSREFAQMFADAGVISTFSRSGEAIELGIAVPAGGTNRRYVVQLFHDTDHGYLAYKECVSELKGVECGSCKVSIDDGLWIRYQWYPEDIDSELTEAGASGDISRDEWQERSNELHDACMEAGLLEQGYQRDVD